MRKKKCPRCKSKRFAKSRIKNLRERVSMLVGNRYLRCVDCGWRGQLKDARAVMKGIFEFILVVIVTFWVALSAYYLFEEYVEDYKDRSAQKALTKPPSAKPKPPGARPLPSQLP